MPEIIIGIDPDSDKHGVARYFRGELVVLERMNLMDMIPLIEFTKRCEYEIEFHLEDVCANNAIFSKPGVANQKANLAVARGIGKCQQSQVELERFLNYYNIKIVKHKISKMWKKDKKQFEMVTGWKGRSNEDTRSAAYFGWLGLNIK